MEAEHNGAIDVVLDRLFRVCRIIFVGYYLDSPQYLASMQHCVDFWSDRKCRTQFVRLAPFLGALGAILLSQKVHGSKMDENSSKQSTSSLDHLHLTSRTATE